MKSYLVWASILNNKNKIRILKVTEKKTSNPEMHKIWSNE